MKNLTEREKLLMEAFLELMNTLNQQRKQIQMTTEALREIMQILEPDISLEVMEE